MRLRVYPNWVDEHGLFWSVDAGDHATQFRVKDVFMSGVSGWTCVDERWTRDESREADAPKMWIEVTGELRLADGVATITGVVD